MANSDFRDFIIDQLRDLDGLRSHAMFGGFGLYSYEAFFGIISADQLYFKTNLQTRATYKQMSMQPFQPNPKQTLKNYFEVPPAVIESSRELLAWATTAIAVALDPEHQ